MRHFEWIWTDHSKDGTNPPQEEFKYLGFRYTEAVSI